MASKINQRAYRAYTQDLSDVTPFAIQTIERAIAGEVNLYHNGGNVVDTPTLQAILAAYRSAIIAPEQEQN